MPGQLRQGQHEPITPKKDGKAPGWVVRCRDCRWAHDAHGKTAAEACNAVRDTHEAGHFLYGEMVDYSERRFGKDGNQPHPLYFH